MGRGILKGILKPLARKNSTVKKVLRFVDPDRLVQETAKYIRAGAQFVKTNWKTPYGKSLLIEQGGRARMRTQPGALIPYVQRKRRRSRSRTPKRQLVRTQSGGKYRRVPSRSRSRSRSRSSKRVKTSVAKDRGGRRFMGVRTRRISYRSKTRLQTAVSKAVRKSLIYQNGMFSIRLLDQDQLTFTSDTRVWAEHLVTKYSFEDTEDFCDMYCSAAGHATCTTGFFERMPVYNRNLTTLTTNDSMAAQVAGFNRFSAGSDVDVKVSIQKMSLLCHYRNNTEFTCDMLVYTFKALKDIKATSNTASNNGSTYSPSSLLQAYMVGTGYVAAAAMAGMSNMTTTDLVKNNPLTRVSDIASYALKGYWKQVSFKQVSLAPGDEFKHACSNKPRVMSIRNFHERMIEGGAYGLYAMKGDLIMMIIAKGGLGHNQGTPTEVGFTGSSAQRIDGLHWRECKGVMLPQASIKNYQFYNQLPTIGADAMEQVGAAVSTQT